MRKTLYIVTSNRGKLTELSSLALEYGIELVPTDVPKLEVQSDELEVIASYAALTALLMVRKPLIVEDSGLFIEVLNGFPGSMSSYFYKKLGVKGILKLMEGLDRRDAYFKSVIAYASPDTGVKVFTGVVYGSIAYEVRGTGGFGFDPIFIPRGYERTFAEMSVDEKNRVSHRGLAFKKFIEWFNNNF